MSKIRQVLLCAGLASFASAIATPPSNVPPTSFASAIATPPRNVPPTDLSTALATDKDGRYTTKVILDGHSPLDFIVDTGAEASSLSPLTAAQLKLKQGPGGNVIGANGSQASSNVTVEHFDSDLFKRPLESMLLIPNASVTDAAGILGMNAFTDGRIEFDFAQHQLSFGPSRPTPDGFVALQGDLFRNNFIIVEVVVDGVHARAMIDTGGTSAVGNPLLKSALGFVPNDPRLQAIDGVRGVTEQQSASTKATLGLMTIGTTAFPKPEVTFADLSVFHALALDTGPSLIIGIDLLSHLQAIAIDFPRAELQLRP